MNLLHVVVLAGALLTAADAAVRSVNPYSALSPPYRQLSTKVQDRRSAEPPDRPLTEIWSGEALNAKLKEAAELRARGVSGPRIDLDPKVLERINVHPRGGVSLGLLRHGGKVVWPMLLKGAPFQPGREKIEAAFPEAIRQAKSGKVGQMLVKQLSDAHALLIDKLNEQINDVTPSDYIQAKRFLNQFAEVLTALKSPDVNKALTLMDELPLKVKTVQDLVDRMVNDKLEFGRAVEDDEKAYLQLYEALTRYVKEASKPK